MQSIFAIEQARPKAFLLEHSDQLQTTGNGALAEAIVTRLKVLQYSVHARVINTSNYGLPQNRSRLWIVGIRKDVLCHQFKWPDFIPHIPLDQLLIPKANDPGHPDIMPTAPMAAQQVRKAARHAAENGTTGDWVVAEHCSKQFMPNPKPSHISPTITARKRAGHWVGTRGRRMTYRETARLQGYDTRCVKFDPITGNKYFLIGNTMSVPVLERLWVATQRA